MPQKKKRATNGDPQQIKIKAGYKDSFLSSISESKQPQQLKYFLKFWHPIEKVWCTPHAVDLPLFFEARLARFFRYRPSLNGKIHHFVQDELARVEKYLYSLIGTDWQTEYQELLCLYKDILNENLKGSSSKQPAGLNVNALALLFCYLHRHNAFKIITPGDDAGVGEALALFVKEYRVTNSIAKIRKVYYRFTRLESRVYANTSAGNRNAINPHERMFDKILPLLKKRSNDAYNNAKTEFDQFRRNYGLKDED